MTTIIQAVFRKDVVVSGLKVAFIVGTVLNLINQGDAIWQVNLHAINYTKLLMTFMVPYLVSTYASVRVILRDQAG